MRRTAAMVLAITTAAVTAAGAVHAAPASWSQVASPNGGSGVTRINGVTSTSDGQVFAVGMAEAGTLPSGERVHERFLHRFDGTQWIVMPPPPQSEDFVGNILGIHAVNPNQIWVTGRANQLWDGTRWTVYPHNTGRPFEYSREVSASSSQDVWAAGQHSDGVLIERWNGSAWSTVSTTQSGALYGVAAVSSTSTWAVGRDGSFAPLIMRRSGGTWSRIPAPPVPGGSWGQLNAVSASSASNMWAVGEAGGQTLTMRWNGSTWTTVPSPNPGQWGNGLMSVRAVSSNEVWAAGSSSAGAMLLRWDGFQWRQVPVNAPSGRLVSVTAVGGVAWAAGDSANAGIVMRATSTSGNVARTVRAGRGANELAGVAALSNGKAWSVGTAYDGAYARPLVEHWNGSSWQIQAVPLPTDPTGTPYELVKLRAVTAISTSDVWAVGSAEHISSFTGRRTVTYHFNGTSWRLIASPNPGGTGESHQLHGLTALSTNDVWAVGEQTTDDQNASRPLILRWNGSSWSSIPAPSGDGQFNPLYGISSSGTGNIWAVGGSGNVFGSDTLTLRWNGTQWTRVASPRPAGALGARLHAVVAAGTNSAWAVGSSTDQPLWPGNGPQVRALSLQWNGTQWSVVTNPLSGEPHSRLHSISRAGDGSFYAVGYRVSGLAILRHDGTGWGLSGEDLGLQSPQLFGVATPASGGFWAVGSYIPPGLSSPQQTLTLRSAS